MVFWGKKEKNSSKNDEQNFFENQLMYLGSTFVVTKHENRFAVFVRRFRLIFAVAQKHHINESD
jgi:hypothetical protein